MPAFFAVVATIVGFIKSWTFVAFLAVNIAFGDYNRRRMNRKLRDAWNSSLKDRAVTVRSTEAPKTIAYGESVVSGPIWYVGSFGTHKEILYLGILLGPGHEITSIDTIYLNDTPCTLDANGNVITSPFVKNSTPNKREEFISNGSSSQQLVLSSAPYLSNPIIISWGVSSDSWDYVSMGTLTSFNVSGNVITVDTSGIGSGYRLVVSYDVFIQETFVKAEFHLGTPNESASSMLMSGTGGEVSNTDKGQNAPYVALKLTFNEDIFPNGVPSFKAKIKGKKIYDPRLDSTNGGSGPQRYNDPSTWQYSNNPALCVRDYLTSTMGFNASNSEIDDSLVIAAANICDELVANQPYFNGSSWVTTSRKRYTCDGVLNTDSDLGENLDMLLSSMAGIATFAQGKWRIYAGAYRVPTVTLTDDDFLNHSDVVVQAKADRERLFNAVKGQYIDPLQNYQVVDFPPVTSSFYESQDGERIFADLSLPFTADGITAQRIALLVLEQSRQAMVVQAGFNMKAYRLWPGETVMLNSARYGFSNKVFRIVEREFSLANLGPKLILREESSAIYTATTPSTYDISPNTTLPNPYNVDPVTGLTMASGNSHGLRTADGTIIPRIRISWNLHPDSNVTNGGQIEVEYAISARVNWIPLGKLKGDATFTYLVPVVENEQYDVRVRAINGLGVKSKWVYSYNHKVVGKTVPPSAPTSLALSTIGAGTRQFSWVVPNPIGDIMAFELRAASGGTINWNTASAIATVPIGRFAGNPPFTQTFQTASPASPGTYSFEVRSIDSSGNVSTSGAQLLNQTLSALKSVVGRLTAYSVSLPATVDGTVTDWTSATTTMNVLEDGVDQSSSWTYVRTNGPGVTSSLGGTNGNVLTVTAMSQDSGYVDITSSKSGYSSITLRFSLSKTRAGPTGPQGPQGPQGSTGQRGSRWFYVSGQTSWSDAAANSAASEDGGPVLRDLVTQYGTGFSQTRFWTGSTWSIVSQTIDGNLLVDGTVLARAIKILTIGDVLNQDPFCSDSSAWDIVSGSPLIVSDPAVTGGKAWEADGPGEYVFSKRVPISTSKNYRLEIDVRSVSGSLSCYLTVVFYDAWGNVLSGSSYPTGWPGIGTYHYFGIIGGTPPASYSKYVIRFGPNEGPQIPGPAAYVGVGALLGYTGSGVNRMGNVRLVEMTEGADIVANTIEVDRIKSGSLAVGRYLQSANWNPGVSGWKIHSDPGGANGTHQAEFANVKVRGDVQATSVNGIDIINTLNVIQNSITDYTLISDEEAQYYNGSAVSNYFLNSFPTIWAASNGAYPYSVHFSSQGHVYLNIGINSESDLRVRIYTYVDLYDTVAGQVIPIPIGRAEWQLIAPSMSYSYSPCRVRLPWQISGSFVVSAFTSKNVRPRISIFSYYEWSTGNYEVATISYVGASYVSQARFFKR